MEHNEKAYSAPDTPIEAVLWIRKYDETEAGSEGVSEKKQKFPFNKVNPDKNIVSNDLGDNTPKSDRARTHEVTRKLCGYSEI